MSDLYGVAFGHVELHAPITDGSVPMQTDRCEENPILGRSTEPLPGAESSRSEGPSPETERPQTL